MTVLVEVFWCICPLIVPLDPKTMVSLASLGRLESACTIVNEVSVQPVAGGQWEGMHMRPGFPRGCSGRLLPMPGDLGLERHRLEVCCSVWSRINPT